MKRFISRCVLVTALFSIPAAFAEDLEQLAPPSLQFLKNLVPAERGYSPQALLDYYELLAQQGANLDPSGRARDVALNERLTRQIRALNSRVADYLKRDELMMWYAPETYLNWVRGDASRMNSDERTRRAAHVAYLQSTAGWGRATSMATLLGQDVYVKNIQVMDSRGLKAAGLAEEPWSETYWADLAGSIAAPYADPTIQLNFMNYILYGQNRTYLRQRPIIHNRIAAGDFRPEDGERLSPAEKYDLLVGDLEFTMSNRVLQMVEQIYDDERMAIWSGVCDGWSSASLNFFRPEHAVNVVGARGHHLKFYPSDIKGLASFLWAKSFDRSATNFSHGTGYQCKDRSQDLNGRLVDPTCNDVNAAYFHIAAVNMIGVDHHGFVFDRVDAQKVMNQPAYKYSYKYFNPRTKLETQRLQSAMIRKDTFIDPFHRYRSPRATHIVGVRMNVHFKKEHAIPRPHEVDRVQDDYNEVIELKYDLELDAQGNIVGGEWWHFEDVARPSFRDTFTDKHPDTLWLVVPGIRMYSRVQEFEAPEWDLTRPMPIEMLPYAREAAVTMKPPFGPNDPVQHEVYRPQPLEKVVSGLLELARPGRTQHQVSRIPGRYRSSFGWLTDEQWSQPDAQE